MEKDRDEKEDSRCTIRGRRDGLMLFDHVVTVAIKARVPKHQISLGFPPTSF